MFCLSFLCAARLMKNDDFSCLRIFDAVNGLHITLRCVRFVHQFITMPLQMLQIDQYQNTLKNLNLKTIYSKATNLDTYCWWHNFHNKLKRANITFHCFTSRNKAIEEEPATSNNSGSEATAVSNIPNHGKIN